MSSRSAPGLAVVTGGAGGIGQAVVSELRACEYDVCSLDLTPDPEDELGVGADVTDPAQVESAIASIVADRGLVEVLVTAAGTYEELLLQDITPERWRSTLCLHLGGTVNICRAVLPGMLQNDRGHLICVTSDLALTGARNAVDYAAAKGAVIGFVRALALELAGTSIRANLLAPGPSDTPMIPTDSWYRTDAYLNTVPARRLVRPDEIARAVRFLIQDGDFYVGQIVSPNAGVAM